MLVRKRYKKRLTPPPPPLPLLFRGFLLSIFLWYSIFHLRYLSVFFPEYSSATKTYLHFFFCNPTTNSESEGILLADNDRLMEVLFLPLSILLLCHLCSNFCSLGLQSFLSGSLLSVPFPSQSSKFQGRDIPSKWVRRHIPMRHIPMATYTHHGGHIPIMGKCLMGPMRHLPIGDIYP